MLTLLSCGQGQNGSYVDFLIAQFKTRVLADSGTFEAEECLKDSLPALIENNPSLCITPNAIEAGKLFSIIPTDGTGDLTVTRATTATRVNSAGLIENVGANIARLDYTNGSCPSILVEPQRTNLVFPSATATTQTRTVTATAHTLSFYGTGTVILTGVATGTLVGTGASNRVTLTFTTTAGSLILTVNGSVTDWQLEAGSNATSYIPTTSATVTRNADVISKTGISSLIGQTEGTLFISFFRTTEFTNKSLFVLFSDILANFISIASGNITTLNITITSGGVSTNFAYAMSNFNKIAIVYSSTGSKVFCNGILVGTIPNTSVPPMTALNLGHRTSARQWGNIGNFALWKTQLTDAEAIQLTTL